MTPPALSLYGSMRLRSAVVSARAAKTEGQEWCRRAWDHLGAAREAATIMRTHRDDYGLAFGPNNVTQHEVSVAVELEEGTEAAKRGRSAHLSPTVPTVRRGHHYIDLARGYLLHGDHPATMRALQQARRIAPPTNPPPPHGPRNSPGRSPGKQRLRRANPLRRVAWPRSLTQVGGPYRRR